MLARDVMTAELVTVQPSTPVLEAARLMSQHDVSALPVLDERARMVGMLSEADLLHRHEIGTAVSRPRWLEAFTPATQLAKEFEQAHARTVGELMSTEIVSAPPSLPLGEVAALLERHRIKRLPIVEGDRLVGIVSRANIIQALASSKAVPQSDAMIDKDRAIRSTLLSRVAQQRWTGFSERNVVVSGGVVHLWGLVGSPEERHAITTLAAEIPGVSNVVDEMIAGY
jgi:CBS domain-containing protein